MTVIDATVDDSAVRFPSVASLRTAHHELLQRRRENGETPEFLNRVAQFIQKGQATGALLQTDDDRWSSQSLLDYWANVLYHAGNEVPNATLAEFDPMLAPELDDALCPYVGLDAFREPNSPFYFGRDRLINDMIDRLKQNRLLAVVGPSGSGKSSVVLAGLLPKLRSGALGDSQTWRYYPRMVPGSYPLANLARLVLPESTETDDALQQHVDRFRQDADYLSKLIDQAGEKPAVLVIDQFEETFTLCDDEETRRAFVDNLLNLARKPGKRHTVILTMRTDFEDQVARMPALQELFQQSQVRLTALSAGSLREAIEKPAERIGLIFEEGLVDELIREMLGEPAALPLLQFTLLKLWENRERNRVTWETYRRFGGGRQALAHAADEFYNSLIPEEQVAAKRILLRIVRPGEGLEVTSNRVRRESLYRAGEAHDRIDRVLNRLIEERLLRLTEGDTAADAQIEVAHEALVRNWPRLVTWLEEERANMRRRLRLTAAAEQWRTLNKDSGALWRGAMLEEALRYEDLNELEAEFVRASQGAVEEARRKEEEARQREIEAAQKLAESRARSAARFRRLAVVLAVVALLAIGASVYAVLQAQVATSAQVRAEEAATVADEQRTRAEMLSEEATRQNRISRAQYLASEALNINDKSLATLLAIEARRVIADEQSDIQGVIDSSLRKVVSRANYYISLNEHTNRVTAVAFSSDGQTLASGDVDGNIRLWDVASFDTQPSSTIIEEQGDGVTSLAFDPNGRVLVSSSHEGTVLVWDMNALNREPLVLLDEGKPVLSVAFSPDGRTLIASVDGIILVWDMIDLSREPLTLIEDEGEVLSVAFSPDRRLIASASEDGNIRLWDLNDSAADPFVLAGHEGPVASVAFSPDGETLASGGADGTVRLWDMAHRDAAAQIIIRHRAEVNAVAFSADGRTLASASNDRTIRLWNVLDPTTGVTILMGHRSPVLAVAFNPQDSGTLASASADSTILVWSLDVSVDSTPLIGHESFVESVAYSPDGTRVASASWDGTARVWDTASGEELITLLDPGNAIYSVAFSPDGTRIVTAGEDGMAQVWDASSGEELLTLRGHQGPVYGLAFSPDGTQIATVGSDTTVRVWDTTSGEELITLHGHTYWVWGVAYSPDGRTLASASEDGTIRLWNTSDLDSEPIVLQQEGGALDVSFSPDGQTLAAAGQDGFIRLWSLADLTADPTVLAGHDDWVNSVAFSADGLTLASASYDGSVRLWDVNNTEAPATVLTGHAAAVLSIAFSPDGQLLASASYDRTVRLWIVDTDVVAQLACQHVRRNLTDDEWRKYFPNEPYRETCSDS